MSMKWLLILSLISTSLFGANTLQVTEEGEEYLSAGIGFYGMGLPSNERAVVGYAAHGRGIQEGLSYYNTFFSSANAFLTDGEWAFTSGIIGAPLVKPHLNIDLFTELKIMHQEENSMAFTPGFEVNICHAPYESGLGAYLIVSEYIHGRKEYTSVIDEESGEEIEGEFDEVSSLGFATKSLWGIYYSATEKIQFHGQYLFTINHTPLEDEFKTLVEGILIGYNHTLREDIEVVTEFFYDIPQGDEKGSFGISLGVVWW